MALLVNTETETELHIGGKFVASWRRIDLPEEQRQIVANMLEEAVMVGEEKKAAEVALMLGIKQQAYENLTPLSKQQVEDLRVAVAPLMNWVALNCEPHTEVSVTQYSAEVKQGLAMVKK